MGADHAKIVASLRRASKPGVWSAGVNLVRAGAVTVESQNDDEIVLRVRAAGRPVPAQVVLYPAEDEWDCDCPGRQRPCEHLTAAAIALGQAAQPTAETAGESTGLLRPSAEVWARVAYRFSQADEGLTLRRFVVRADGGEMPLEGSLAALLARPAEARTLQVEQCDLQADRLLETSARAVLPPSKLDALIQVLVGCGMVFLDGRQIVMSEEEVLPHAVVTDQEDGVAVTIRRDPRITAVPSAGVVLLADELARHGELELCGGFLQHLPRVRRYAAAELGDLATRILPELSRRMAVEVRTGKLPRIARGISAAHRARAAPARLVAVGLARPGLRPAALRAHRRRSPRPPGRPGARARRAGRAAPGREAARRARPGLRPARHLRGRGDGALRGQAQALARRAVGRRRGPGRAPACTSSPSCGSRAKARRRARHACASTSTSRCAPMTATRRRAP